MRRFRRLFVSVALYLFASSAYAQAYVNGNKLIEWLEAKDPAMRTAAYGYIQGVVDAMWFTAVAVNSSPTLCLADGVTPAQLAEIVHNHYRRFPERRHYGASGEIYAAVNEKFPCKR